MCHHLLPAGALLRDADALIPTALPRIDGVVECATPEFLGIRTSDGGYRLIHAEPAMAGPPPAPGRAR
ncbi:MAG TPA: hypothetical protein VK501_07110 [Baekduia sp.]|uniref:hypothetical protein n=1 Tax=Baekduia sp. TaxID=2600305 RepID=UPI002BBD0122|nr:hypothetical protein [Baekduia sp.]HMJ33670.1 hypothetical protein [Baekduia sp.]